MLGRFEGKVSVVGWKGRCTRENIESKPEVKGRGPDLRHLGVVGLEVAQNPEVGQDHATSEHRWGGCGQARTGPSQLPIIRGLGVK